MNYINHYAIQEGHILHILFKLKTFPSLFSICDVKKATEKLTDGCELESQLYKPPTREFWEFSIFAAIVHFQRDVLLFSRWQ